ncbi:MAG: DUF2497 domain-containing protein [Alphaproteobacteria bacterium]|nr:DUF2497 domain-containing protein [Alphaproteobacteria bacterium]MBM3640380.1 DUF2497 domain-containing protein [Alphaproteobacteria bacterium]
MTAANASVPSRSFQDEARANEPSMEEILASIRRLIADDDAMPGAYRDVRRRARADVDAAPPARSAYPAPVLGRRQDEQPLSADASGGEFGEAGAVRLLYGADAAGQAIEERSDAESPSGSERVTEQERSGAMIADASGRDGPLLSAEAGVTVASRFQALAAGVAFSETDILDRCAQEMLRPMVEQWLNENLPSLVERLVRGEIERITRAGVRVSASGAESTQP